MSTRRARVDRPSAGAVTLGPDEPAGPAVDAAVADLDDRALEVARSAAADEAGDPELVGPPVDTVAEDGPIVTVRFASLLPGYRGWQIRFYPPWEDFPGADIEAATARMNRFIEERVREAPAEYFWAHKRFKTRPPGMADVYGGGVKTAASSADEAPRA